MNPAECRLGQEASGRPAQRPGLQRPLSQDPVSVGPSGATVHGLSPGVKRPSSEPGGWEGPGEHLVQTHLSRGQGTESQETRLRCQSHASWAKKPGLGVSSSATWTLPTGQVLGLQQTCPSAAGKEPPTLPGRLSGAKLIRYFLQGQPLTSLGYRCLGGKKRGEKNRVMIGVGAGRRPMPSVRSRASRSLREPTS